MASKRKREFEESMSPSNAKQLKTEEVTRSGRVRKKPAKFSDDNLSEGEIKHEPELPSAPVEIPLVSSPPVPVARIVTVTSPVPPVKQEIEFKDEDDDSGKGAASRTSRARKKSAKVLEMEEFEEAEKKQTVKKDGGKKLKSPPAQNVTILQSGASVMMAQTPPIPVLKIKDIPTMPKIEPVTPGNIQVQVSPHKSPTAGTSKSPTAGGSGKSPDNKGSVIKLLLSSPTQSAGPAVSTTSVSQLTAASDLKPPPSGKKGKSKGKSATVAAVPTVKSSPEQKVSKIRQALQSPPVGAVQIQPGIIPMKHKAGTQPASTMVQSDLINLSDDDKVILDLEGVTETVQTSIKETKVKKGVKKTVVKDESPFLSPPVPSPNVIHVGPMNIGLEVKQETESLVKKGKKGKGRDLSKMDMSEAMMHEDFGLDMPEIELGEPGDDSFMDMDDEDSLMIPEEEVETERPKAVKSAKKKGGKVKGKVQLGDIPPSTCTDGALVMDFARMKSDEKKKKKEKSQKEEAAELSSKKKRAPTAYMMWCSANRPKLVYENPGIDFSTISKTLGEMWSNLSEKEKMLWKRKSKKASGKGSTLITTGKTVKAGSQTLTARQTAALSQKTNPALAQALLATKQMKPTVEDLNIPIKGFGMDPIDVAAHLKILGESLSIIGMKLQEHRGLIAVQGSLSVLLDSMLCALTPLMCLTAAIPETNGLSPDTHMKNLDNIAYIMPGL